MTDGILQKAFGFRELLGPDLKEEIGKKYTNLYAETTLQMKDDTSYKPIIKQIEKYLGPNGFLKQHMPPGIHIRFFPMGKQLIIRFYSST